MGWAFCGTNRHGQEIGYGVEAICDEPGCDEVIDRGLGYLCGDMHDTDKTCAKYYCGKHMGLTLCSRCARDDDSIDDTAEALDEAGEQLRELLGGEAREEIAAGLVALLRDIADRIEKHYGCEVEET